MNHATMAGHKHGTAGPDTRSLRSLLRDDSWGSALRSLATLSSCVSERSDSTLLSSCVSERSERASGSTVRYLLLASLVITLPSCSQAPAIETTPAPAPVVSTIRSDTIPAPARVADVRALLSAIAHDSMEGRFTGSRGGARAARMIEAEMTRAGLKPGGDSGYFQRVPFEIDRRTLGEEKLRLLLSLSDRDTLPPSRVVTGANVIGILPGTDSVLRNEIVVVGAHYDHLGFGRPVDGDSIFNGADDDGSGTVATIMIFRALGAIAPPRRTIIFIASTGEEQGVRGTRYYIEHPTRPLEQTVADMEIEMIGRPDSLAGGRGRAWLTGFERSTMGESFAAAGLPIGPDKRPGQSFFARSDNIAFARMGLPAHTLSSFNLHGDYHQVTDEVGAVDFEHMAAVIDAATKAVELLANGPTIVWKPGGKP